MPKHCSSGTIAPVAAVDVVLSARPRPGPVVSTEARPFPLAWGGIGISRRREVLGRGRGL